MRCKRARGMVENNEKDKKKKKEKRKRKTRVDEKINVSSRPRHPIFGYLDIAYRAIYTGHLITFSYTK